MKKTMLLCCLLFCIHIAMAQTKPAQTPSVFDKFMSAITNMPALFQKLVDNVNKLAKSQNKEKFHAFDTKIIDQLSDLKRQKLDFANSLKLDKIKRADVEVQIKKLKVAVDSLKNTVNSYQNLLDGLNIEGFQAAKLRASLNDDFAEKNQLLNRIIDDKNKKNDTYASNVSMTLIKATKFLDSSIVNLQKLDSELRK